MRCAGHARRAAPATVAVAAVAAIGVLMAALLAGTTKAVINPTGAPARNAARNVKVLRGKGTIRINKRQKLNGNQQDRGGMFMVKFFLPSGDFFYCGGSLVGKNNKVLSAAHCFEGADVSEDVVRVGGVALFDGFEAKIASVEIHPDYDPITFANDLAVVTLSGMPSSKQLGKLGVFPAKLNKSRKQPKVGELVTMTGWGVTSGEFGAEVSADLATTTMRINRYNECVTYLRGIDAFLDGLDDTIMICSSLKDNTSSCSGDSGGPIFRKLGNGRKAQWRLYGVLSFGFSDGFGDACPVENPEWYTRVSAYQSWLASRL